MGSGLIYVDPLLFILYSSGHFVRLIFVLLPCKTLIHLLPPFRIVPIPNGGIFAKTGEFFMTENEKKLLQAKHRLEEAEMRDRQKERKARTRRLIQEGAILEKALPQTTQMTLEQLENFLCEVFKTIR